MSINKIYFLPNVSSKIRLHNRGEKVRKNYHDSGLIVSYGFNVETVWVDVVEHWSIIWS